MKERIQSLEKISHEALFEAFKEAFRDYEMQLSREELLRMLKRRGFVPELSFGAFSGNRLVAFTFNGVGSFKGLPTAYDTGTGTIEDFRGSGLASRIFEYSIPHLKNAGISQYLLEVLQHNERAVSLYRKLGFRISREFDYFVQTMDKLNPGTQVADSEYSILAKDLKEKELSGKFWDHQPSWQNSFAAVERSPEDFLSLCAYRDSELLGYCIFEPGSGDITQLAVEKRYRRRGIASLLLRKALQSNKSDAVKAINYEIGLTGFRQLMKSFGISHKGRQYEMIKQL